MMYGINVGRSNLKGAIEFIENAPLKVEHLQIGGILEVGSIIETQFRQQVEEIKSLKPYITYSYHAYTGINLSEKVDRVRKVWIDLAKEIIHFAGETGACFVNFHLGLCHDASSRHKRKESLELILPGLKELVYTAMQCNVEVHIENTYSPAQNCEISRLGDRLSDFDFIFENIDSPILKLCYDYGHGNIDEHGIEILHKHSNRLGSIHAHDNDQVTDIHAGFGRKGVSSINWEDEWEFLNKIRFSGPLIFEGWIEDQIISMEYIKRLESKYETKYSG